MKAWIGFVIYIFLICIPITGVSIICAALVERAIGYPVVVSALVTAIFVVSGGAFAGWLWTKIEEKFFA